MKSQEVTGYHGKRIVHTLEAIDFDYLKDEFTATDTSLGIDLVSISNPLLSIHIGQYSVKYDNDISARRMFIALERVDITIYLLTNTGSTDWFKPFIPNTTEQLKELIEEFKFKGLGNVKDADIKEFLNKTV